MAETDSRTETMWQLFDAPRDQQGRLGRRELLRAGALTWAGLNLPQWFSAQAQGESRGGRAKSCILVLLNGGMAQQDTFDMKPGAPEGIRGPYQPIATTVPGIQICEKLPQLAQLTHKLAIVRSAHHHLLAHNTGAAYALSGHSPGTDQDIAPKTLDHPTYGSVISKVLPAPKSLPSFVLTPTYLFDMGFPTPSAGGGWLGKAYDPFPVVRNRMMAPSPPWEGKLPIPEALQLPEGMNAQRLSLRKRLWQNVDEAFSAAHQAASLQTLDQHQAKALDLILSSETQAAFDLSREPADVHDRYGRFEMGQVFLLARRMIEAGVRFVTANAVSNPKNTALSPFQIWDTHFDHFRLYNDNLLPEFDQALSALITDLDERNLLDETLIVVMGEFGRTPKINTAKDGGRDHWSRAYSMQFIGGGMQSGVVYGATDQHASDVTESPVMPDDIAATIYESLGIPHDLVLHDLNGQPRRISDGQPIWALMS